MRSGLWIWVGLTCPAEPRVNALMPYPFPVDHIAPAGGIGHDCGSAKPPPVVEIHAGGAVGCPPVQVIQCPQRRGKRVARSRNAQEVVIGFGEPVAQARRGHRSEIIFVEPGIGSVRGARRLSSDRGAGHPFGDPHPSPGGQAHALRHAMRSITQ